MNMNTELLKQLIRPLSIRALSFARALGLDVNKGPAPIAIRYDIARSSLTSLFSCCACLRVECCAVATKSAAMETGLQTILLTQYSILPKFINKIKPEIIRRKTTRQYSICVYAQLLRCISQCIHIPSSNCRPKYINW